MADDFHGWLDSTIKSSQLQWEYILSQNPDDPSGWGVIFEASLQEESFLHGSGVLLTGPDDYSKQAAAAQMVRLLDAKAYACVFLDGAELTDGGMAQARVRVDGLLDYCYDRGEGLCLILQGLENCRYRWEILNFVGQKLCEYHVYQAELTPLLLILVDDREQELPSLLRSRLRLCRVNLPDESRRAAFLKRHGRSLRHYVSLDVFAQATEGVGYGQLLDMIAVVGCLLDSRDGRALSDEELKGFLAGQMPAPSLETAMRRFYDSAQKLTDQFPKLLKEAVASIPVSAPVVQTVMQPAQQPTPASAAVVNPENFLSSKRQEIENMPPRELAEDLFGKEAVMQMCMN